MNFNIKWYSNLFFTNFPKISPRWYRPCPAIRAFLTKYDLSNKTIIPFATNAGWLGRTFKKIEKLCSNSNIKYKKNIVFESYSDELKTHEKEIESWIDSIDKEVEK